MHDVHKSGKEEVREDLLNRNISISKKVFHEPRIDLDPGFALARREIIQVIRSKEEGLNTRRVEDFLRSQGLQIGDYLFVDEEDIKAIKLIMWEHTKEYSRNLDDRSIKGFYDRDLDLVFIKTDKEKRDISMESLLVHELTHSSSPPIKTSETQNLSCSNWGFIRYIKHDQSTSTEGLVFEEGIAEMIAIEYQTKNMSLVEKIRLKIAVCHDPSIKIDEKGFTLESIGRFDKYQTIPYPLKYWATSRSTESDFFAYAGFALELLCRKIKGLRGKLLRARNNQEELAKIAELINELSPGLFLELNKLHYAHSSKAVEIIINKVYGGKLPKYFE